jgi:hypothetical protein
VILFKHQAEISAAILRGEVTKELQIKYQDMVNHFFLEEKEKILPYLQAMYEESLHEEIVLQKKSKEPHQIADGSSPSSSSPSSSKNDWATVSHGKPVPPAAVMHHMTTAIWNDLRELSQIIVMGCTSFIRKVPARQRSEDGVSSLVVSRLNHMREPNTNIVYEIRVTCTGTVYEGLTEIKYIRLEDEADCSEGVCKKTVRCKTEDLVGDNDYMPMFHNIIAEFWETYYPRKTNEQ